MVIFLDYLKIQEYGYLRVLIKVYDKRWHDLKLKESTSTLFIIERSDSVDLQADAHCTPIDVNQLKKT